MEDIRALGKQEAISKLSQVCGGVRKGLKHEDRLEILQVGATSVVEALRLRWQLLADGSTECMHMSKLFSKYAGKSGGMMNVVCPHRLEVAQYCMVCGESAKVDSLMLAVPDRLAVRDRPAVCVLPSSRGQPVRCTVLCRKVCCRGSGAGEQRTLCRLMDTDCSAG